MNINELIEKAVRKTGSRKALAEFLKKNPGRITEWGNGLRKPDACEIAKIALLCKLPILKTIAEVEIELHPETRQTWEIAINELNAPSKSQRI